MTKGKKFFAYAFLTIVSVISVFPLYWMMVAATNKSVDVTRGTLIFGTALFDNVKKLFASQNVATALGNSFKYSIIMTFFSLLVCSIAGYGFEVFHD
ncbi:MAG: carbohydrate ABC transporter permease, partial [Lacrimispora sphenoides]